MFLLSNGWCWVVAAAALLQAGRSQVTWCPDYDQAFAEARDRNVPILIAFIQDGEEQNEQMVRECYSDREFIRLTEMTVNLIASTGTSDRHGTIEVEGPNGELRKICKKFGTITCIEHQKIEQKAFQAYATNGTIDTPHHILLSPQVEILSRADDYVECSRLVGMIRVARQKVGSGLDRTTYEKLRSALVEGEAALAAKEYRRAAEILSEAANVRVELPIVARARAKLGEVEGKGEEILARAKVEASNKRYVEALTLLDELQREFRSFRKLFKEAAKQTQMLFANPDAKEAKRIFELEPRARKLLEKAFEELRGENPAGAAMLFGDILEKFDGTPSAKIAREKLEELRSDPETRRRIDEAEMKRDCSRWLMMARKFLNAGHPEKAREQCELLLEKYPEGPYADEAREILEEIDRTSDPFHR